MISVNVCIMYLYTTVIMYHIVGGYLVAEEVFRHFAHICQYFWGELYGNRSNYLSHVFRTKLNYNVYKVSK